MDVVGGGGGGEGEKGDKGGGEGLGRVRKGIHTLVNSLVHRTVLPSSSAAALLLVVVAATAAGEAFHGVLFDVVHCE